MIGKTMRSPSVAILLMASLVCSGLSGVDADEREGTSAGARYVGWSAGVADHGWSDDDALTAVDLTHGGGWVQVDVVRTWRDEESEQRHFGPGWADGNVLRLRQLDAESVVLWRGGLPWRLVEREGGIYRASTGETLRRLINGWVMEAPEAGSLTFGRDGRLTRWVSPFGRIATYTYDGQGRLAGVAHDADNYLRYHYAPNTGRVTRIEGPEGLEVAYRYDSAGRLSTVVNSRGIEIRYGYAADGRLRSARDTFGNRVELPAAAADRGSADRADDALAEAKNDFPLPVDLPPLPTTSLNEQGLITATHDRGGTVRYEYDRSGRLVATRSAAGAEGYGYDTFGRINEVHEPDGRVNRIEYNALDLPTRIVYADGSWEKLTYDRHGRPARRKESTGGWREWKYDARGRLATERGSPGWEQRFEYDERDRVARFHAASGETWQFEYDASDNPIGATASTGERWRWSYDADGRRVAQFEPTGLKTEYAYDGQERLAAVSDPLRGRRAFSYPSVGTALLDWEGQGRWQRRARWDLEPLTTTDPAGRSVTHHYDERGRVAAATSPTGRTWAYDYDPSDRLGGIVAPGGGRTRLEYDAGGRVTSIRRGDVAWRKFAYDPRGRLLTETGPDGTAARYVYNDRGQVSALELPAGKVTLDYDKSGQLVTAEGPGYKLRQEFHPDGRLARRAYEPSGLDLKLPLDRFGRPAGVELNDLKAAYEYDRQGRLARIRLPGKRTITIESDSAGRPLRMKSSDGVTIGLAYDRTDRITSVGAVRGDRSLLFLERYKYDAAGNLVGLEADGRPPSELSYDRDDRLVRVAASDRETRYRYAPSGELESVTAPQRTREWELDASDRPLQDSLQTSYAWDAAGNLVAAQGGPTAAGHVFDAADQLAVRRTAGGTWQHGYLSDGDRLWRRGPEGTVWFCYLQEGLVGLKDTRDVTWLVVTLPGRRWPLALCSSDGQTLLVIADPLGSIRRLVDPSGKIVASADYGPYGELLRSTGEPPLSVYAGMVRDPSGIYYARRRYYDAGLARFISLDPWLGSHLFPASHDAYAYAAGNPFRYTDPTGTSLFPIDIGPMVTQPWVDPQGEVLFNRLTEAERAAAREAYEGIEHASKVIKNVGRPGSSYRLKDLRNATSYRRACVKALRQLHRRASLRWEYYLRNYSTSAVTLSPAGREFNAQRMAQIEQALRGASPQPPLRPTYTSNLGRTGRIATRAAAETGSATGRIATQAATQTGSTTGRIATQRIAASGGKAAAQQAGGLGQYLGQVGRSLRTELGAKGLSTLRSVVPRLLGPLSLIGAGVDIWTTRQAIIERELRLAAEEGAVRAQERVAETLAAIREGMRRAVIDPQQSGRLIPLQGLPPIDPRNPDPAEIERRVQIVMEPIEANVLSTSALTGVARNPFEGVVSPAGQVTARQAHQAALARATELIAAGEGYVRQMQGSVAALGTMETAAARSVSGISGIVKNLPVSERSLAELRRATTALNASLGKAVGKTGQPTPGTARWLKARQQAEAAAKKTCGLVHGCGESPAPATPGGDANLGYIVDRGSSRPGTKATALPSGNAPNPPQAGAEADCSKRKAESQALIKQVAKAIQSANKATQSGGGLDPKLARQLRAEQQRVVSRIEALERELQAHQRAIRSLSAARTVLEGARQRRDNFRTNLAAFRQMGLIGQVDRLLAPFWNSSQRWALQARANQLQQQATNLEGTMRILALGAQPEQLLRQAESHRATLERFAAEARSALAGARGAAEEGRQMIELLEKGSAAAARTAALKAFQRALACHARIKVPQKKVKPDAARPAPLADAARTPRVPDVVGKPLAEAKAAIAAAGLVSRVQTGDKPPAGKQPQEVYGLRPAAGTRLPRKSPVDVTIYAPLADEGFQPGDGTRVDPRFAAARVTDGELKVEELPNLPIQSAGAGPRCAIEASKGSIVGKLGTDGERGLHWYWSIKKHATAAGARQLPAKASELWKKIETHELGEIGFFRVVDKRLGETDARVEITSLVRGDAATGRKEQKWSVYCHAVVYRDVFLITTQRGLGTLNHRFAAEDARIIEASKRLIDLRFPPR